MSEGVSPAATALLPGSGLGSIERFRVLLGNVGTGSKSEAEHLGAFTWREFAARGQNGSETDQNGSETFLTPPAQKTRSAAASNR
jgi:hypothetical protein